MRETRVRALAREVVKVFRLDEEKFFRATGARQTEEYAYPRFIAILLAGELIAGLVDAEISRALNRHPTAVKKGRERGRALLKTYPPFQAQYHEAKQHIEQWLSTASKSR